MESLQITARLGSAIYQPQGWVALDSLLACQRALQEGLIALDLSQVQPIEIPVQREPAGRFHLCSVSLGSAEAHELQYTNKRPVIAESQLLGQHGARQMRITTGVNKGFRIPRPVTHTPVLKWWCLGDRALIQDLLSSVSHIGKKRSVGLGRVQEWKVEGCEIWDGFPVVKDGVPLRPLPLDWPGLNPDKTTAGYLTLTFPYWDHSREELCALPAIG